MNIEREFGDAGARKCSVHDYIERRRGTSDADIVYYDHGTGEIADFVSFIRRWMDAFLSQFYHCKKSPSPTPGNRLDSVTELAGQVVKSVTWAAKQRILESIRRRFTQNIGAHRFIREDLTALLALLEPAGAAMVDFEFIAVQPGLKKDGLSLEIANVLAGASDYLVHGGFRPLKVLCS